MLRRRLIVAALPALALMSFPALTQAERPRMRVVRDPGCGCCMDWVRHIEQAGFDVSVAERPRTDPVRRTSGAPPELIGCHVGLYDRFAFEGHVPAAAIRRFLADPGPWRGLAVPDMPTGSPGMEINGVPAQTYDIMRFDQAGRYERFARAQGNELI